MTFNLLPTWRFMGCEFISYSRKALKSYAVFLFVNCFLSVSDCLNFSVLSTLNSLWMLARSLSIYLQSDF